MAFSFLSSYLSVEKLKELLPDLSEFKIEKYPTVLTWGYGDSLDRERVRDIMFEMFPAISYKEEG